MKNSFQNEKDNYCFFVIVNSNEDNFIVIFF